MKTQKVKFADIPVRSYFYDAAHSCEWMLKLDDSTAMWEDGLQTEIAAHEFVEVVYPRAQS